MGEKQPIDDIYYTLEANADLLEELKKVPSISDVEPLPAYDIEIVPQVETPAEPAPANNWRASELFPGQDVLYAALETALEQIVASGPSVEPFLEPVSKIDAPDYYDIIKHPMDLHTMREKLYSGAYYSKQAFIADLRLIFLNCRQYNTDARSRVFVKSAEATEEAANAIMLQVPELDFTAELKRYEQKLLDELAAPPPQPATWQQPPHPQNPLLRQLPASLLLAPVSDAETVYRQTTRVARLRALREREAALAKPFAEQPALVRNTVSMDALAGLRSSKRPKLVASPDDRSEAVFGMTDFPGYFPDVSHPHDAYPVYGQPPTLDLIGQSDASRLDQDLMKAVAVMLTRSGFESAHAHALEVLAEVTASYAGMLGRALAQHQRDHGQWSEPGVLLNQALCDVGLAGYRSIENFALAHPSPPAASLPELYQQASQGRPPDHAPEEEAVDDRRDEMILS